MLRDKRNEPTVESHPLADLAVEQLNVAEQTLRRLTRVDGLPNAVRRACNALIWVVGNGASAIESEMLPAEDAEPAAVVDGED